MCPGCALHVGRLRKPKREKNNPCLFPTKSKENSVTIIRVIGSCGGIVISFCICINIRVTVTRDRVGEVFLGYFEEGFDGGWLVPVINCETCFAENFLGLNTM